MRRLIFALLLLLLAPPSWAATLVTYAWDAPASGPTPIGYKLHCGPSAGNYTTTVDVGNVLQYQILLLSGQDWYCVASAYTTVDGPNSNELLHHIKPEKPTGVRRGP